MQGCSSTHSALACGGQDIGRGVRHPQPLPLTCPPAIQCIGPGGIPLRYDAQLLSGSPAHHPPPVRKSTQCVITHSAHHFAHLRIGQPTVAQLRKDMAAPTCATSPHQPAHPRPAPPFPPTLEPERAPSTRPGTATTPHPNFLGLGTLHRCTWYAHLRITLPWRVCAFTHSHPRLSKRHMAGVVGARFEFFTPWRRVPWRDTFMRKNA